MKYRIDGDTLPVVICELEAGEAMITERGSMSWMSPNMRMETTSGGGLGRALGRTSCAMIAVTDTGLAAGLLAKLAEQAPERYGECAEILKTAAERRLHAGKKKKPASGKNESRGLRRPERPEDLTRNYPMEVGMFEPD